MSDQIVIQYIAGTFLPDVAELVKSVLDTAFAKFTPEESEAWSVNGPLLRPRMLEHGGFKISRDLFGETQSYFIKVGTDPKYWRPVGLEVIFRKNKTEVWWIDGDDRRIPTAEELEQATSVVVSVIEHFAVGSWAEKAPGSIATLKKVHRALVGEEA